MIIEPREHKFKPVIRIDHDLKQRIIKKKKNTPKYKFDLPEWYVGLLLRCTHCFYTGKEFSDKNKMSFERLDNTKGYVVGNVIPVSVNINSIKSHYNSNGLKKEIRKYDIKIKKIEKYVETLLISRQEYVNENVKLINGSKFSLPKAKQGLKKIPHLRLEADRQIACLKKYQKHRDTLIVILKALCYYRRMSTEGIILSLSYQQRFDPSVKFKNIEGV